MVAQSDSSLHSSRDQFRRLTVLIAVATVDMIGGAMVFPLIPFYALKLNASPTTVGMIIASFFVAQRIGATNGLEFWLPLCVLRTRFSHGNGFQNQSSHTYTLLHASRCGTASCLCSAIRQAPYSG